MGPIKSKSARTDFERCAVAARRPPRRPVDVQQVKKSMLSFDHDHLETVITIPGVRTYLTLRHGRSTNTLSRQAPLPSMLIAMPLSASTPVKAAPVNCEPWSGIEDFRFTVLLQGILQRLDAECRFHCDRHAPRQNAAACPGAGSKRRNTASGESTPGNLCGS